MKRMIVKKKTKLSGSDVPEINVVINKIISTSSKLLKICMENPNDDQARIAFNSLHTLRWALDIAEKFKERPESFAAMLKFINDVNKFAEKLLKETIQLDQYYLEIMKDYDFGEQAHG